MNILDQIKDKVTTFYVSVLCVTIFANFFYYYLENVETDTWIGYATKTVSLPIAHFLISNLNDFVKFVVIKSLQLIVLPYLASLITLEAIKKVITKGYPIIIDAFSNLISFLIRTLIDSLFKFAMFILDVIVIMFRLSRKKKNIINNIQRKVNKSKKLFEKFSYLNYLN